MSRNADAIFFTRTMTRGEIADQLNDYLDVLGTNTKRLARDDDRLTFDLCVEYASFVSSKDYNILYDEFRHKLLVKIGMCYAWQVPAKSPSPIPVYVENE